MGRAIVNSNSSRMLVTSKVTVILLLLNSKETEIGEMKTPKRLVVTERSKARGKLPPHYASGEGRDGTWSARIADEARTVGLQHIEAIPIISSRGVTGISSTR